MTILSMVTEVDPEVVLYLHEDPYLFQARVSSIAARFLSTSLEQVSRLGGDSPISSMGRILSAVSATELLMKEDFAKRGTSFLTASIQLAQNGELMLYIKFEENFLVPTFSSTAIQ